ncbi:MAG TPA: transcriptional regulator [Myxococcales bacterium]|nr:transcriptional regulator [Myxococcales bacterium]
MTTSVKIGLGFLGIGIVLMGVGSYIGLVEAPPDRFMGDVQRIMYVHVPTAWNALLIFTIALGAAIGFLVTRRWGCDDWLQAQLELGVLYTALLCAQGAIWGKPTWGVWWSWDPRLTTTAIMLLLFAGILALRANLRRPSEKASLASVATILAWMTVPVVYMSVRWWNSLHQIQSTPKTVDAAMVLPLRMNAFAMLFLALGLTLLRARTLRLQRQALLAPLAAPEEAGEGSPEEVIA